MSAINPQPFDQIVFAGGGNRCWWQAGWWDTVAPELHLRPRIIAGISAGAATACMVYAHDSHQTMAYYREVLANNSRNAYWGNLLRRERVFPHYGIYRNALPDGAYHNQVWIEDMARRAYMARGIFGQFIYVDPAGDFAVVQLATWPEFVSDARTLEFRAVVDAIRAQLVS